MRGMYQGTAFEEKDIEFILGEGKQSFLHSVELSTLMYLSLS